MLETLLIVVCVIFLFLGSWRSVLIPVVAIPISLIGAAFLMLAFGFTLNLLTLLAIVLSVGLVVDDAIVVVENVERHIHEGETPFNAAIHAARELVGPIIAMTITLAAVYAPIGIQGGLTGALFREFAFTLAGAVVVSGVVALTLSPMMASRLLARRRRRARLRRLGQPPLRRVRRVYTRLLVGTLEYRAVTLLVAGARLPAASRSFTSFPPRNSRPKEDQGVIFGIVQASPNSTLDQTTLYTRQVSRSVHAFPEKEHIFQLTFPAGDQAGFSGMVVKPWSERHRSTTEILPLDDASAASVPGIGALVATPQPLPGGSNFEIEFVVASTGDPRELLEFAKKLQAELMASTTSPFSLLDLKYDQPQAEIVFDRDKVASIGLNLGQVGADLSTMLGGNYINRFSIDGPLVQGHPASHARRAPEPRPVGTLSTSRDRRGSTMPLSTFAKIKTTAEPRAAEPLPAAEFRQDPGRAHAEARGHPRRPRSRCSKTRPTRSCPRATSSITRGAVPAVARGRQQIPAAAAAFAGADFPRAGGAVRELLAIRSSSCSARCRSRWRARWRSRSSGCTTLNIYANVGLVTLVGLVSKNGILIVEFANKLQEQGLDKFQAVVEGGRDPSAADLDDDRGDGGRAFPADPGVGSGRRRAQFHRLDDRHRHDHRYGVHVVHGAVDLPAPGP